MSDTDNTENVRLELSDLRAEVDRISRCIGWLLEYPKMSSPMCDNSRSMFDGYCRRSCRALEIVSEEIARMADIASGIGDKA